TVTLSGGHFPFVGRECLLPDKKSHPVSRLVKMSSSDTETRHPQLDNDYQSFIFFVSQINYFILRPVLYEKYGIMTNNHLCQKRKEKELRRRCLSVTLCNYRYREFLGL
uniref:Uncharacterized protein n=1 Tax=Anolis carolinensis TaxID=28377 RepID=A0A803TAS5_ANOCA